MCSGITVLRVLVLVGILYTSMELCWKTVVCCYVKLCLPTCCLSYLPSGPALIIVPYDGFLWNKNAFCCLFECYCALGHHEAVSHDYGVVMCSRIQG